MTETALHEAQSSPSAWRAPSLRKGRPGTDRCRATGAEARMGPSRLLRSNTRSPKNASPAAPPARDRNALPFPDPSRACAITDFGSGRTLAELSRQVAGSGDTRIVHWPPTIRKDSSTRTALVEASRPTASGNSARHGTAASTALFAGADRMRRTGRLTAQGNSALAQHSQASRKQASCGPYNAQTGR